MKKPVRPFDPIRLLVHAAALFPLAALVFAALTGGLSINPIQDATQRSGQAAILLLIASLACTPVFILTGWRKANTFRRPLGLYAAFYAASHFLLFAGVDYGFSWPLLSREISEKRYIVVGAAALLILLALAATSFRYWQKRLGKNWKWLHRLVYLASGLVILHYGWVVKGDFLGLRGDVLRPWIYGAFVAFLLIVRLPPVRSAVLDARRRITQPRRQNPLAEKGEK
jgi:sulfoxide reductase heme-binding subunit YedZ